MNQKARSNVRALVSAHNQHGALCVTHYSCGVGTEQISGDIRSMGSNDDHMSGDLLRQFQNAVFGRAFLNMDMHSVGWQFKFFNDLLQLRFGFRFQVIHCR